MRRIILSALAALIPFIASQAHAVREENRFPRWYVGLSGQVAFLEDSDVSGTSTGDLGYDTGYAMTASLGYSPFMNGVMQGLRVEGEVGYHFNQLGDLSLSGVATPTTGDIRATSYMGNLLYDFNNSSSWTPYLGAGAGMSNVKLSSNSGVGNRGGSDDVFAYQFMAGLSFAPTSIPLTEWNVGYRYFSAGSPEFATATGNVKLDDYTTHGVELGARFRF